MKAIILAGGYATRLWPLTKDRAKPLLLLNGKPLISHIVDSLPEGMEAIIYTNEKFKKDFEDWQKEWDGQGRVTVGAESSKSEKEKKGALGAVTDCIEKYKIKEDVLVIGGDNFFGFSIKDFIKEYKGLPLLAAYNIGSLKEARKFGVLNIAGKKVVEFYEKPENPNSTLVSTLCTIIPQTSFHYLFDFVREYKDNIGKFIEYLLDKTEVRAYVTKEHWFDIGSFEGYIEAHKRVERKEDRGLYLGGDFWGKNTLKGKVFIDRGTIIKDSHIEDCIIMANVRIENCHLKNCIIDEGARLTSCKLEYQMIERGIKMQKEKLNGKKGKK